MWLKANVSRANERASRFGNAKRRALDVLDRLREDLCVPKIRFCNIDDEGRQGQAVM
jgi:hypothetical protein